MNLYEANLIIRSALADQRPRHAYALFSGGHDSYTATHVAMHHPEVEAVVHIATGTGIPETFRYVQEACARHGWRLIILRPPLDEQTGEPGAHYRKMVLTHGFPGPGGNVHRVVYSELKEKALRPLIARSKKHTTDRVMLIGGMRAQESIRRMGHAENIHRVGATVWVSPLVSWTAIDCADYMEQHDLPRSIVKDELHISGECLCGCFAKPEERKQIAAWYPHVEARIRALEAEAEAAGVPARWGQRPGKYYLQTKRGQLDMFLCASCMREGASA